MEGAPLSLEGVLWCPPFRWDNSFFYKPDPHQRDADPDPACHLDPDPDPACPFDADPDPVYHFDPDPAPTF